MKYLIVGYGNIGHKRHDALKTKCIATLDPNPKTGANFTNVEQINETLLKKIDAVVITVPRRQKIESVLYWLSKNKHVLVEKPMIVTEETATKINNLVKKNKVIYYTAYNYRFEPHIIKIKKILKKKTLGKLYYARMTYGFGNVAQLKGTWRDTGYGALDEVGCHLVDLSSYLFGYKQNDFEAINLEKFEAKSFDHCLLATKDRKVYMEASWVMWKNLFEIEAYFEKGSIHMTGLCKWGESQLLVRKRILPAGIPKEKKHIAFGPPDPTWKNDVRQFEKMVSLKKTSLDTDLQITKSLIDIIKSKNPKITSKSIIDKLLENPF